MEAQHQGHHIYIYADGPDEYHQLDSLGSIIEINEGSDDHADARLEGQSEIAELFLKHAGNPYLKMCISSRSQPPFEDIFANITGAGLRLKMGNLTRPDIFSLVHSRLKDDNYLARLEAKQPGFREDLLQDGIEKAYGVFTTHLDRSRHQATSSYAERRRSHPRDSKLHKLCSFSTRKALGTLYIVVRGHHNASPFRSSATFQRRNHHKKAFDCSSPVNL